MSVLIQSKSTPTVANTIYQNRLHVLTKEEVLKESISRFYSKLKNIDKMNNYINNYRVSTLDWFLTNYSKNNNTFYEIRSKKSSDIFFVNTFYKAYLKEYKKEYFDPFCRGKNKKFNLEYFDKDGNKKSIITTIARLHAFKWCIENKVVNYITRHYDEIHDDLCEHNRKNREEKRKKAKKIKRERAKESKKSTNKTSKTNKTNKTK